MNVIVLDRDGVINQDSPDYIKSADEWAPIPGSIEAIARLSRNGYRVTIATNQSGLARGLFSELDLAAMHNKLCTLVEDAGGLIDGIFICPHLPEDKCSCRKPATGLLSQIQAEYSISLLDSFFIGDSSKDVEAAIAFGLRPVLVRTGKGSDSERKIEELARVGGTDILVFDDLANATDYVLANQGD